MSFDNEAYSDFGLVKIPRARIPVQINAAESPTSSSEAINPLPPRAFSYINSVEITRGETPGMEKETQRSSLRQPSPIEELEEPFGPESNDASSTGNPSSSTSSQVWFYIQIAFFAMCGCLARIGSDKIFGGLAFIENQSSIISVSFYSNVFGSFALGVLTGSPLGKSRLTAMYKGLTTGFCGSFTTWSKWNQQNSLTLVGASTQGATQMQVLSISAWFVGFYAFTASYAVGLDFGKALGKRGSLKIHQRGPSIANACAVVLLLLATAGFLTGLIVDDEIDQKKIWMATLMAPFGACLRFLLSRFNVKRSKIPYGTLLANVLGAVILAGLAVILRRTDISSCIANSQGACVPWSYIAIYGLGTGFCASLTTVSTFVSEIYNLRSQQPRFAYGYAVLTVVICQVLTGIINGVDFHYDSYF